MLAISQGISERNKMTEFEEQEIVNDDPQIEVIEKITDPEELEAAKELIKEDIDAAIKEGTSKEDNPDLSKSPEELEKEEDKLKEPEKPPEFTVNDEFIEKQPEEVRALLTNFKGKGKADLAKATAHAVALKNPYIKDNEEAITAIAKKLETGTEEELVQKLIETQKEVGKPPEPEVKAEPKKIELPELEETEEVKKTIQKESAAKLKKLYPGMPDDLDSVEYKEWLRDLQDEDLRKANKHIADIEKVESEVKTDLRKVVYLEKNHANINNERLENEVKVIKDQLTKFGVTEKDLGIDLTLKKDENGLFYNENLNSLMRNGGQLDPYVVGYVGDLVFLKTNKDNSGLTPLAKKLFYENNFKLIQVLNSRESENKKKAIEQVKDENLNVLSKPGSGKSPELLTPEAIEKITDESAIKKLKLQLENEM